MNDLAAITIIAVVCLGVGFALGTVIAASRSSASDKKEPPAPGLQAVAHIWRKPDEKELLVQVGKKAYSSSLEFKRAGPVGGQDLIPGLRAWLGESPPNSVEIPAVTPSKSLGQTQIEGFPLPESPPENPARRSVFSPVEVISRVVASEVPKIPPVQKSIPVQIDAILQEKLSASPLKDRGIRLLEFPGKGMVVMVGLDSYDGVDAVPDEEIRRLIRESAREWEQRG
jgi:hypothetical protein